VNNAVLNEASCRIPEVVRKRVISHQTINRKGPTTKPNMLRRKRSTNNCWRLPNRNDCRRPATSDIHRRTA